MSRKIFSSTRHVRTTYLYYSGTDTGYRGRMVIAVRAFHYNSSDRGSAAEKEKDGGRRTIAFIDKDVGLILKVYSAISIQKTKGSKRSTCQGADKSSNPH